MNMYVAYYKMTGLSPDLPVWVEARDWDEALGLFQIWRDRKTSEGKGHLIATKPFRVESDIDALNPMFGISPDKVAEIRANR